MPSPPRTRTKREEVDLGNLTLEQTAKLTVLMASLGESGQEKWKEVPRGRQELGRSPFGVV